MRPAFQADRKHPGIRCASFMFFPLSEPRSAVLRGP